MTFCFILDVSSSLGSSILIKQNAYENQLIKRFQSIDIAKAGVESLTNLITKQQINIHFILSTTKNDRSSLLSLFGDSISKFESKLKNLDVETSIHSEYDFSYALSLNLNMFNKHRLKNMTDSFGYGMRAWKVEPLNCILFTDSAGLKRNQNLSISKASKDSQNRASLSEYIKEAFRWDQHIYLIAICEDNDMESQELLRNGQLSNLCRSSGGDVFRCSDFKSVEGISRDIFLKIACQPPTVNVKLQFNDNNSTSLDLSNSLALHLQIKNEGYWVIPENYWADLSLEHLKARDAHPILTVTKLTYLDSPKAYLQLARDLGVKIDTYDLLSSKIENSTYSISNSKSSISSAFSKNGYQKDESLFLYVANSNRMGTDSSQMPFAIICPVKKFGGYSYEFHILPYNFPVLLNLVKQGKELLSQGNQGLTYINEMSSQFSSFLYSVPQYYHESICQMITNVGLKTFLQGIKQDAKLHKTPFRRIQKVQEQSTQDIALLEKINREDWPEQQVDSMNIAITSASDIVKASMLPKSNFDLKAGKLLETWENMRKVIYGGSCLALQGLSVNGMETNGRHNQQYSSNVLFESLGAETCCKVSVKQMSDYIPILAKKEALRDPTLSVIPPDEDEPSGLLRRKLDVNFGNRYRTKSKKTKISTAASSLEIEGISGLIATSDISMATGQNTLSNDSNIAKISTTSIEKIMAQSQLFFADTPNPYVGNEDSIDLKSIDDNVIDNTDKEDYSVGSTASFIEPSSSNTTETSCTKPTLPSGWIECFSIRQNRIYWFNQISGKSSWEFPQV